MLNPSDREAVVVFLCPLCAHVFEDYRLGAGVRPWCPYCERPVEGRPVAEAGEL
jgi:hypothetical protein